MIDTMSSHHESISTPIGTIWSNYTRTHPSPTLNLLLVEKLVHKRAPTTGSKRSAEPGSSEHDRKRTKTSNGYSTTTALDKYYYPAVPTPPQFALEEPLNLGNTGPQKVAVLSHRLDIYYDGLENEPMIVALLQELKQTDESTVFLGDVTVVEHGSRLIAMHGASDWLMVLPQVTNNAHEDDDDYTQSPWLTDLVLACDILSRAHKTQVRASVSLVIDGETPSLHLQVKLQVSLSLPHIFLPLSRKEPMRHFESVGQAQRRLLSYVYAVKPADRPAPVDVNISFFYSALRAARPLSSLIADDGMQPDLLNPTLLPFQRRSVGWLLGREGMGVTPQGEIVPNPSLSDFSFWTPVTEGNDTWYLNRLSGDLSMEPPPPSPVALGGILAEEPGLGKTLEIISLILLNPPDVTLRNPSVTRYDPEARLEVKAIKTSLIVTPPALASQWADEIAAHAPSLKVLIYDGWSKVKVPIARTRIEEERNRLEQIAIDEEKKAIAKAQRKKLKGKAKETKAKAAAGSNAKPLLVDDGPDMTRDAEGQVMEWCDYVQQFDVVITTYQVLRSDFNVARAPPVRPRREDVVYLNVERPRSPLVMVEWNRVIMDEVQMVGGAKLEDMVSLIPRLASFAVSGTPARAQISDLIHVLKFLRVYDIIGSVKLWKRLIKPGFAHEFSDFLRTYSIRTTKASVKGELTIPEQTRFLVPIELGKIEQHVYDQAMEAVLLELGLDARGIAGSGGWQVDSALLRSSIRKLRGICTHPQVGQLQKKGDSYKRGALKSMDAVLENMRDQNWKNIMEDWKAKIQLIVRYAQLMHKDERMDNASQVALEILQAAEKEINNHINEITTILADNHAKGEILKREAAEHRQAQAVVESLHSSHKGKEKADDNIRDADGGDLSDDEDEEEESNVEDRGLPKTHAGNEHRSKTHALRSRLREGKLILHRVQFLMGDTFHGLGRSTEEDTAYEYADKLRKELLKVSEDDASRAMEQLSDESTQKRFDVENLRVKLPYLGKGGIRSADLMEEANELIEDVLIEQTNLLLDWRAHVVDLLTQKLTGKEEGTDGDGQEYQRNLDNQGEAEAYMQAYAALLADRREALINERTLLAAHNVREKKLRHTKAAMKAAALPDAPTDDLDLQPEHEVVYKDLSDRRKALLKQMGGRAVKSILVDLNAVLQRLPEKDIEKVIVTKAISDIRRLMTTQSQLHDKLDVDLVLIRKAFNERILYFKQLQEISDSVAEVEWDNNTLAEALQECLLDRAQLDAKINTNRARHRYLVNLVNNKSALVADNDNDENACILCRCDFIRGFITHCAHIFCERCMKVWMTRREGKACPVCRVRIDPNTVQRFTVNPAEAEAPKQPVNGQVVPQSTRKIPYNFIDPDLFQKIQQIESLGDFGSKIQTLVQHLLYLQLEEPGAKSIIFSAWADSLHIVEWALRTNGIRCLRIDQNSKGESAAKKFRTDPDILVLLLHGERENAGLNVTCASRVFLLESVVHHSFEIQAIARIDRMGQTRPTQVYCYYAEDTVERNVLDLAARNGLSLYTKDRSAGTLDVSSFSQEIEQKVVDAPIKKKLQKGDFIFKVDDMLAILFPHMFEEVEYLLPQESDFGDVEMADSTIATTATAPSTRFSSRRSAVMQDNAVPGPSRMAR